MRHPPKIRAVALVHQEGALTLVALVGLAIGERGVVEALASRGDLLDALLVLSLIHI